MILPLLASLVVAQGPACTSDVDCVVTTFEGCCGACCQPEPYSLHKDELARRQQRCAVIDCDRPSCDAVRCKQPEPAALYRASCRAGGCVAVRVAEPEKKRPAPVPVPAAQCRVAADCAIIYPPIPENAPCRSSPCGCCPSTNPVAVPVEQARRPEPLPLKDGDVKYGLSPGNSSGMRRPTPAPAPRPRPPDVAPPACSPCMGPVPARALCEEGRCVVAPHALRE